MISFRGRWTPEERTASRYRELPFEVPATCPGIRTALTYDRTGAVIDLGLIDPLGWRGWSGAARDHVLIGPDAATPGYVNRGLPPGEWRVVLGLHQIPAGGADYHVTVSFNPVAFDSVEPPPLPQRPPRRMLPCLDGHTWLAGDLHTHTVHSDGVLTVDELAGRAVAVGLDYLAITDHNTISHHEGLPLAGRRAGITLVAGQEVTTAEGHANAFGEIDWIDFREPPATWAAEVADRGGLLSINHPVAHPCAWQYSLPSEPDLAEIWHSSWHERRQPSGSLAWWQVHHQGPTPVGGSDWHRPGHDAPPGSPTTWVTCIGDDVMNGLATGITAVSATPDGPVLLPVGDELVAVDADGAVVVCSDGRRTPLLGNHAVLAGHSGRHLLEAPDGTVLGITS